MRRRRGWFMKVSGYALVAGLAISAAGAASAPSATAVDTPPPPRTDVPCQGTVQGVDAAGDLRLGWNHEEGHVGTRVDVPRVDPGKRITAMGDVFTMWDDGAPDETFDMTHEALVVSGGRLRSVRWTRLVTGIDPVTQKGGVTTWSTSIARDYGRGWGGMSSLHQSPIDWENSRVRYLYGFSKGTLHRYAPVGTADPVVRYRSAGKVSGFSAVRGIALVSSDSKNDQFLMTTTTGSLIRVTVPQASRMTTKAVRLRNTGWASYTTLVPARCEGKTGVVAVNSAGHGRLFVVGRPNGLRTAITPAPKVTNMSGWRAHTSATQMP